MPNYVPGLEGWERGARLNALQSGTGLQNVRGMLAIDAARREQEEAALMNPLKAGILATQLGILRNPPPKEFSLGPGQARFREGDTSPYASQPFKEPEILDPRVQAAKKAIAEAGRSNVSVQVPVSVGAKETDKKFAEDYVAFATGGFADTVKQLDQLREVSTRLDKAAPGTLTGTLVGNMPDALRAATHPESIDAQNLVEEVVQRNLRLILGAQFTEKEGERLISRAYNPRLDEKTNKARVDRLITQIGQAAQAKLEASRYFMAHGTLQGWKGKLWTMGDFNPEGTGAAKTPSAGGEKAPSGVDPKLWAVMTPEERALFK